MSPNTENEETRSLDGARARRLRERDTEVQERLERMRAIAKRTAALPDVGPPLAEGEELSIAHGDYLYDEHGLPK